MDINFKLKIFEGPLDLLLHLIEINEIDIYDIPISEITSQYMDYLNLMKEHDLTIISEFLVMAATLLDIKARMLLPAENTDEDEGLSEDPRAELVQRLLEYKMMKSISATLKDKAFIADKIYYKEPSIPEEVSKYETPVDLDMLIGDITLTRLNRIFRELIRKQEDKVDPIRAGFGKIKKEEISVDTRIEQLRDYCRSHESFSFRRILNGSGSKLEIIVSFLAILELMKMGDIVIRQDGIFDDIMISSNIVKKSA